MIIPGSPLSLLPSGRNNQIKFKAVLLFFYLQAICHLMYFLQIPRAYKHYNQPFRSSVKPQEDSWGLTRRALYTNLTQLCPLLHLRSKSSVRGWLIALSSRLRFWETHSHQDKISFFPHGESYRTSSLSSNIIGKIPQTQGISTDGKLTRQTKNNLSLQPIRVFPHKDNLSVE